LVDAVSARALLRFTPSGVGHKSRRGKFSNISVNRDIWPVLSQHSLAERLDLAEGDGSHSGSFESEREAANAGKEIEDIHFPSNLSLLAREFFC
jgi:hypothetical protein